jgi:acetyltransferase-like isoleucine patch superfamily enzyme
LNGPFYSHPTSEISEDAKVGENTKIWHFAQVRERAVLGNNCIVGKGAYIGAGVKIGSGTKIQNFATIYQGVTIEDDVFIGPHVVFTNDKYPRAFSREWKILPTVVRRRASIGANSTVLCGLTIGTYSMVGAGSVVTRDVPPHALVVGNPAKAKSYICRCGNPIISAKRAQQIKRAVPIICSLCGESNVINPVDENSE